jgi:PAS domain S-box-containing protein
LKKMFGLKPDDALDVTKFFSLVHPEDRESVRQAFSAISKGWEESAEFRVLPNGGQVRWLMSRGNWHKGANEEPSILMGITVDITERRKTEEALRTVSGRLLGAQEQERKRIARELHDGINQRVALIVFGLEQLNAAKNLAPAKRHQMIDQLGKDAQAVANEIQALSHKLHASSLDYLGLETAIEGICWEMRKLHGTDIVFTHRNVPKSLPPDLKLALFRIAQEALHNAMKYSGVNSFEVSLRGTRTHIELTVRDSGVGFDVNKATQGHGLGLISMRERVVALKGVVTIRSRPGSGTEISACVPIIVAVSPNGASANLHVA